MSATPSAEPVNRLLNDPFAAVDEMLDGIVAAFPGTVRRTAGGHCLLSRSRSPNRRICVVTGGGSGHEPAFFGYLGRGLADAAAIGNVFASPSATPVIEGVTEIAAPALFIFGNYDGDVMNFGMAADLLAEDGVQSDTVLVTDDVVSAPRGSEADRRGVAGDLIVIKAAGARADEGASLEEVAAAARYANERTRTAGVGLSACTLPTSRIPSFDLPVGLMDVGIGLHGEAGIRRGPVASADEVVDELLELVMAELPVDGNAGVSVVVNLLGELLIVQVA